MPKWKVGNPNIWNEAKKAGTTFKKWKSGNPSGRPKKGIWLVNEELIKEGYLPAKRQDIEEVYMSMVQLEQRKLTQIRDDINRPMIVRIIAKAMLSGKWFDIIERMIDRAHWKSVQKTEELNPMQVNVALSKQEEAYLGIIYADDDEPEDPPQVEEKTPETPVKKS